MCCDIISSKIRNLLLKNMYFSQHFQSGPLLEVPEISKLTDKMAIFDIQLGVWAFIRVWAFNRIFRVCQGSRGCDTT